MLADMNTFVWEMRGRTWRTCSKPSPDHLEDAQCSGVSPASIWNMHAALVLPLLTFGACPMLWCYSCYHLEHAKCSGVTPAIIWSMPVALVLLLLLFGACMLLWCYSCYHLEHAQCSGVTPAIIWRMPITGVTSIVLLVTLRDRVRG